MPINLLWEEGAYIVDKDGRPPKDFSPEELGELLSSALRHQDQCKADVAEFLKFYFNPNGYIDLQGMNEWLATRQPLDKWFYIHLMEMAGSFFYKQTYSAHKRAIASSKNKAPRAWCVEQWSNRDDTGQSKNAFSRVYAPLVKKQFGVAVTPDTIARAWLKGCK